MKLVLLLDPHFPHALEYVLDNLRIEYNLPNSHAIGTIPSRSQTSNRSVEIVELDLDQAIPLDGRLYSILEKHTQGSITQNWGCWGFWSEEQWSSLPPRQPEIGSVVKLTQNQGQLYGLIIAILMLGVTYYFVSDRNNAQKIANASEVEVVGMTEFKGIYLGQGSWCIPSNPNP